MNKFLVVFFLFLPFLSFATEKKKSFNDFPAPSERLNLYYLWDKYVINIQPYREIENLLLYDLPDLVLYKDKQLKEKIGEFNEDGIVLNSERLCMYERQFSVKKILQNNELKYVKDKRITYRKCFSINSEKNDLGHTSFLNIKDPYSHTEENFKSLAEDIIPDGYFTINIIATEIIGNVAKVETKAQGAFYIDLTKIEKFKMRIAPPMQEYLKAHPIGQKLLDDVTNFDKFDKKKVLNSTRTDIKDSEMRIINFQISKLFESTNDTICFDEIRTDERRNFGRWCYYDGYIFTDDSSGTTQDLGVKLAKEIIIRQRAALKKKLEGK